MGNPGNTYQHPLKYQVDAYLSILLVAVFMPLTFSTASKAVTGITAHSPYYEGANLLISLMVPIGSLAVTIYAALSLRSLWFYVLRYDVTDSELVAFDPVLRRRYAVPLDAVTHITTFVVFGQSKPGPVRTGHILVTKDGNGVKLSEALPIWPEIAGRFPHSLIENRPMPWWEVRR